MNFSLTPSRSRSPQMPAGNGFSLVEMLVALLIFALLAAGAVSLLSFSLKAEDVSRKKLAEVASLRRFNAIVTNDMAQVAPRLWRDELGQQHAAFLGSNEASQAFSVMFVSRNAAVAGADSRPSLQRIWYYFDGSRLQRTSSRNVDGGISWETITLLDGISNFQARFRSKEGTWRKDWNPVSRTGMPVAVELTVESRRWKQLRLMFLVGIGQ